MGKSHHAPSHSSSDESAVMASMHHAEAAQSHHPSGGDTPGGGDELGGMAPIAGVMDFAKNEGLPGLGGNVDVVYSKVSHNLLGQNPAKSVDGPNTSPFGLAGPAVPPVTNLGTGDVSASHYAAPGQMNVAKEGTGIGIGGGGQGH